MREEIFLGEFSEKLVANFLESSGYKIVRTRFRKKNGEIDIIAILPKFIVFIEVKYRNIFQDFEGIINEKKLEKVFNTAEKFLAENQEYSHLETRFDAIFIDKFYHLQHLEGIL